MDLANQAQIRCYEKTPNVVGVTFCAADCIIDTLEGQVRCHAGDALITGVQGERWPVSRNAFEQKYCPVAPTEMWQDGQYQARPARVLARRLDTDSTIALKSGNGTLSGQAGDWLVQYETGDQSIVRDDIFCKTYRRIYMGVPLLIGIVGYLTPDNEQLFHALCNQLPHTKIFALSGTDLYDNATNLSRATYGEPATAMPTPEAQSNCKNGAWGYWTEALYLLKTCSMVVVADANESQSDLATAILEVNCSLPFWNAQSGSPDAEGLRQTGLGFVVPAPLINESELTDVIHFLPNAISRKSVLQQVRRILSIDFRQAWGGLAMANDDTQNLALGRRQTIEMLCTQIAQLDWFNRDITNAEIQKACQPSSKTAAAMASADEYSPIERTGAIADRLASINQDAWQALVYSKTASIESHGGLARKLAGSTSAGAATANRSAGFIAELANRAGSLVGLGVIAAVALGASTELAGSCDDNDWIAIIPCVNPAWERFAGFAFLFTYLLILIVALYRYAKACSMEYKRIHQDYRMLAECLRVQHVWNRLGIGECIADSLPPDTITEASWVRKALHAIQWRWRVPPDAGDDRAIDWATRTFLDEQIAYHRNTLIGRRERVMRCLSSRAQIGLVAFFVLLVTLELNFLLEAFFDRYVLSALAQHFFFIFSVVMLGVWAANRKIIESYGFESEVHRGRIVLAAMEATARFVKTEATTRQEKINAFARIGRLFAADQAAWHTIHRSRPIEAVTGG
jgi:hypothetical protein